MVAHPKLFVLRQVTLSPRSLGLTVLWETHWSYEVELCLDSYRDISGAEEVLLPLAGTGCLASSWLPAELPLYNEPHLVVASDGGRGGIATCGLFPTQARTAG
jgi:hypothetical protein